MTDPSNDDALTVAAGGRELDVALGAAPAGRLVFATGAAHLKLRADPALDRMLRARFEGSPPRASLEDETVMFRYPRLGPPFEWRRRRGDVTLSATIPWEIDVRGGAADVDADLRRLHLLSLRIGSGASGVEVELPPPQGVVAVTIGGGASNLRLNRPAEIPIRLRVRGGTSKLTFDDDSFGAIGGATKLQSSGFDGQPDYYEISIGGGASRLSIRTR